MNGGPIKDHHHIKPLETCTLITLALPRSHVLCELSVAPPVGVCWEHHSQGLRDRPSVSLSWGCSPRSGVTGLVPSLCPHTAVPVTVCVLISSYKDQPVCPGPPPPPGDLMSTGHLQRPRVLRRLCAQALSTGDPSQCMSLWGKVRLCDRRWGEGRVPRNLPGVASSPQSACL